MKTLYFLLDISASMSGEKISSLNDVMENLSAIIADEDVSVRIMTFSRTAQWLTDSPVSVTEYIWQPLTPYGMTAMGAALTLLDRTLRGQESVASDTPSTTTSSSDSQENEPTDNVVDYMDYEEDASTMAESITDLSFELDLERDGERASSSQEMAEGVGNSSPERDTNSAKDLTIILITDGYPTDDFELAINRLNSNEIFQNCQRIAITIGDEADKDIMLRFTSDKEKIYPAENIGLLEQTLVEIFQRRQSNSTPQKRYTNEITEPEEYKTQQPTSSSTDEEGDEWD